MFIRLDPEFASYQTIDGPAAAANARTKFYRVTDRMHTLPRGLWDTTVTFDEEITDVDVGMKAVVRAPLGLVQHSEWKIVAVHDVKQEQRQDGCEWYLTEDVHIKASRLLVGTVKGKCEENWKGIHKRFVDGLVTAQP